MEKAQRKEKREIVLKLFWIFMIGCVAGFIIEGIVTLITRGHFELRQGVIYGPFAQVYGIGTLAFYLILPRVETNTKRFLISMALGAIVEYMCSYLQEMWFGTISWNYTNQVFNLNGRTSLFYALCWGGLGLFFHQYIYPIFQNIDKYINKKGIQITSYIFIVFMLCNFSISFLAGARQKERIYQITAKSSLDSFLDEHYPDNRMNAIYGNKIRKYSNRQYFYGIKN